MAAIQLRNRRLQRLNTGAGGAAQLPHAAEDLTCGRSTPRSSPAIRCSACASSAAAAAVVAAPGRPRSAGAGAAPSPPARPWRAGRRLGVARRLLLARHLLALGMLGIEVRTAASLRPELFLLHGVMAATLLAWFLLGYAGVRNALGGDRPAGPLPGAGWADGGVESPGETGRGTRRRSRRRRPPSPPARRPVGAGAAAPPLRGAVRLRRPRRRPLEIGLGVALGSAPGSGCSPWR